MTIRFLEQSPLRWTKLKVRETKQNKTKQNKNSDDALTERNQNTTGRKTIENSEFPREFSMSLDPV